MIVYEIAAFIIGISLDKIIEPINPLITCGSAALGTLEVHILIKILRKEYETGKSKIEEIINTLANKNININTNNLVNSLITKETAKVKNKDSKVKKTTIKKFYLLDNEDKIRVLKEVKQTLLNENKKKVNNSTLYLEENIDNNELPVTIKRTLTFK